MSEALQLASEAPFNMIQRHNELLFEVFAKYLSTRKIAFSSVLTYEADVGCLVRFATAHQVRLDEATPAFVDNWLTQPLNGRKSNAMPRPRTIAKRLVTTRQFYRSLVDAGVMQSNPATAIDYHENKASLRTRETYEPVEVGELAKILAKIGNSPEDTRDVAMLHVLFEGYASVTEIARLKIDDLNVGQSGVSILTIAGRAHSENRLVYLGSEAATAIHRYLETVRPAWAVPGDDVLFLSQRMTQLSRQGIWKIFRSRAERAGLIGLNSRRMRAQDPKRLAGRSS